MQKMNNQMNLIAMMKYAFQNMKSFARKVPKIQHKQIPNILIRIVPGF